MTDTAITLAGIAFGAFMGVVGYKSGQQSIRNQDFLSRVQVVTYLENNENCVRMKEVPVHMASGKITDLPREIASWPRDHGGVADPPRDPSPFRAKLVYHKGDVFLNGCTAKPDHCFGVSDFKYAKWAENKGWWPYDGAEHKLDMKELMEQENIHEVEESI